MNKPGTLYLIPVPVAEESGLSHIPAFNTAIVQGLKHFVAEDAKTARRFLKLFNYPAITEAEITLLNEHSKNGEELALLTPLLKGEDTGLMSDAGCPGIADPGAELIKEAHKRGIPVVPLTGPSSIVLSIMASGFNGQNFAFVGYLPIEKPQKIKRIKELEQLAIKNSQAQFFIETPYRNEQLLETLLSALMPETRLFIGKNLTSPEQFVKSMTVAQWKKSGLPSIHKIPVVFGIYKG